MIEWEGDYWSVVEPIWGSVSVHQSPDGFMAKFLKLTQLQQALYSAHWCQSEVLNGGLSQFFMNSTGVLCPEAIQGYRTIGMPLLSGVLSKAASWFGKEYPRSRGKRLQLWLSAGRGSQRRDDVFKSLTRRFLKYHDEESGGFDEAANTFAAQNCRTASGGGESQGREQTSVPNRSSRGGSRKKRTILVRTTKKRGRNVRRRRRE